MADFIFMNGYQNAKFNSLQNFPQYSIRSNLVATLKFHLKLELAQTFLHKLVHVCVLENNSPFFSSLAELGQ